MGVGVRPENHLAVEAGSGRWPARRHPRKRALANQRSRHLCGRRRHRGTRFRHRRGGPSAAGRTRQPPGPPGRRPCLRPRVRYRGTQGTAIVGVFQCTAAITGASEKTLRRTAAGPFARSTSIPPQHAGYYPGAEAMTLKLLFDPQSGRMLGARPSAGPASTNASTCWPWPSRPA